MGNKKYLLIALVLMGIGSLGIVFLLFFTDMGTCAGEAGKSALSPDGKVTATIYSSECPMADQMFELRLEFPGSEKVVFAHYENFDFCWKSANELVVESLPGPITIEREAGGVSIIYGDVAECGEAK